jgi:MFS transporter, DHA1 family, multidrug resistance protein
MQIWKKNLIVCWFGMFVNAIGMSQIAPVLPLFIQHLGVDNTALIEQFSGIAFGVTYIISAIFSPVWGQAADKFGRKPMLLRASLGTAIVIISMGFAQNVYELIGLRVLMGVVTGYSTACITLIATQTDNEHAGWALGTLSTASVAGSLLGPLVGGYIEENLGLQNVFFITGAVIFVAFITTVLFVTESFTRQDKKVDSIREIWSIVPNKSLSIVIFATFFMITLSSYTVEPIITVYVTQLSPDTSHVALLAGLAFSSLGLANIIASPILGKVSDKIGAHKVMLAALVVAGIFYIPQAFAKDPWQLIVLRFLAGLATAGLNPSVYTLVKKTTPDSLTGRVMGFSISAGYLGIFIGSILGGQVAAYWGIKYVFFVTSSLLLINAVWVYFTVYKKLEKNENLIPNISVTDNRAIPK